MRNALIGSARGAVVVNRSPDRWSSVRIPTGLRKRPNNPKQQLFESGFAPPCEPQRRQLKAHAKVVGELCGKVGSVNKV